MRDEIMKMATEAGFSEAWLTAGANPPHFDAPAVIVERFYNLAVQHERKECAKRLDAVGCDHCAANIRARGEKQ